MRCPRGWYQIHALVQERLWPLSGAEAAGLAVWVYGTLTGGSACQTAVLSEWLAEAAPLHALRQRLREFLYDGADKAAPCTTQLDVPACFGPLLAWVLDWWTDGQHLPLAIDATNLRDEVAVLVVSVLYRSSAIPVAWAVYSTAPKAPGQRKASWTDALVGLLDRLRAVVPPRMQVLVCVDQGLRSPRLRRAIRACGWHPMMRLLRTTWVRPAGTTTFVPADALVPGPGHAWAGRATIYKQRDTRVEATLLVVWDLDQQDVWVLLTDLAPRKVGVVWYALRMWVELGFRALQGVGWQWQRTRRTDPARVARHWLVLAVAMLLSLAVGTRLEDAARVGRAPAVLRRPPAAVAPPAPTRMLSVFVRGRAALRRHLLRGGLWRRLWLSPEPWPQPHARLHLILPRPPP